MAIAPGGLELLGTGRTAEIFAWEDGRVLRLYREGASESHILREMRSFRIAHEAQFPCPAVYPADSVDGLVRLEGRLGFVMDRVDGPSMLRILTQQPWRLLHFARAMAGFHLSMHQHRATGLPSQRARFHSILDRMENELGAETLERIRNALDQLPDGNAVCHGDFHPDNVLLAERGAVIIDWGPATSGTPAADVARTAFLLKQGQPPPDTKWWERALLTVFRRLFFVAYKRAYARHASFAWRGVEAWAPVIAAIRFADHIPEERAALLAYLHERFDTA